MKYSKVGKYGIVRLREERKASIGLIILGITFCVFCFNMGYVYAVHQDEIEIHLLKVLE